jgi:protein-L-isoaspartate(D-aspartate) O-methyltransferase
MFWGLFLTSPDKGFSADETEGRRDVMVATQIASRGVKDPRVLDAMRRVPRHLFVSKGDEDYAYDDGALPIGLGQTISQPYIVALMTELARIRPTDKVLEIGTGSGYQAAVLGELAASVYSIEIIDSLARRAAERLKELGYKNIVVLCGDGYKGWPDQAPFDAIIVTAAPPEIPEELVRQLAPGGRMVIPVGTSVQNLIVIRKNADGTTSTEEHIPVRFVPMVTRRVPKSP